MLDGGWPPVTRFGESFLRMAMSRPRVLQNGLEGSWPSKRIRTSAGSFARNKYVWPRFWPEKKHYVRGREYARRTRGTHRLDTGQRAFGQSLLPMRIIVIPLSFRCCTDVSCKCSSSSSSFFFLFSSVLWLLEQLSCSNSVQLPIGNITFLWLRFKLYYIAWQY